jgi:hypothetical protein
MLPVLHPGLQITPVASSRNILAAARGGAAKTARNRYRLRRRPNDRSASRKHSPRNGVDSAPFQSRRGFRRG